MKLNTPFRAGAVAVLTWLASVASAHAQCAVNGPTEVCAGSPTQICASAGASYQWTGPSGFTASTQCVQVTAPGTYTARVFDGFSGLWFNCTTTLTAGTAPAVPTITGPANGCDGEWVTLCGPGGRASYAWSGPNGFTGSTECVDVNESGPYTLTVSDVAGGCTRSASMTVTFAPCGGGRDPQGNCPRSPAWWNRQCRPSQRGPQVDAGVLAELAAQADARAASLEWKNALEGFCEQTGWEAPRDLRWRAKRQVAALFVNLAAYERGLVTRGGAPIGLSADVMLKFNDDAPMSAGAWAAAADAELASLESRRLRERAVKRALERIIRNTRMINLGENLETQCKPSKGEERTPVEPALWQQLAAPGDEGAVLAAPTPNPFRGSMQVTLAIADAAGAEVDVAVFDLAGRRLATLLRGHLNAGAHTATWNGRTDRGEAATPGMYFLRGRAGADEVSQSVILAR